MQTSRWRVLRNRAWAAVFQGEDWRRMVHMEECRFAMGELSASQMEQVYRRFGWQPGKASHKVQ